jgi:hypothetical protein
MSARYYKDGSEILIEQKGYPNYGKYKLYQEDINRMDLNGEILAKLKQNLPKFFMRIK